MSKNIALFIDGTWNKSVGKDLKNTNVFKLYKAADNDGQNQVTKYLEGVGTDEWKIPWQPRLLATSQRTLIALPQLIHNSFGGAFGRGTATRIRDAYQFLSGHYEQGDKVYLFGFSRGAFAARSLAGFIDAVGLLLKDYAYTDGYVENAFALYKNGLNPAQSELRDFLRDVTGAEKPNQEDRTILPIYLIGVWDTVAALGLPSRLRAFNSYFTEYHQPQLPSNVTYARHALALHELREVYEPLLWLGPHPQNSNQITPPRVMQVWFAGAHADVGGGYPETGLSDIALDWMTQEATSKELKLRPELSHEGALPSPEMTMHHEIRGIFSLATPIARKILSDRSSLNRETLETFYVHLSATNRLFDKAAPQYTFSKAGVNQALTAVDELTLKLYLEIGFKYGNAAVGSGDPVRLAPRREKDWWEDARVSQASSCATTVRQFFENPETHLQEQREEFVQSLCLWVMCDSATAIKTIKVYLNQMSSNILKMDTTTIPKINDAKSFLSRLKIVVEDIDRCAQKLPSELQDRVNDVVTTSNDEIGKLTRTLDLEIVKVKAAQRKIVIKPS